MERGLRIVKLGGSVVTHKEKPLQADHQTISRLSGEVAEARAGPLIIVHGGGSYGHYLVHHLRLLPPSKDAPPFSVARVIRGMDELSQTILKSLLDEGVAAVSVPTFSVARARRGEIVEMRLEAVSDALDLGLVPLLRGDMVSDSETRYTVVSGDQVSAYLATALSASAVIMCVDTDGILDGEGKLVREVSLGARTYEQYLRPGGTVDVTGGLRNKMEALTPLAERGVQLLLINARAEGRLRAALRGEDVVGTRLRW